MKKILLVSLFSIFSMIMVLSSVKSLDASSGLCFLCGSGSSCEQCPSPSGNDTQNDRKACENKGCKISGYTSCSGAANIKYCR